MGDSGKIDEMKGRIHKGIGEVTDDPNLKQKGTVEKVSGAIKQGVERVKESIEHAMDRAKK